MEGEAGFTPGLRQYGAADNRWSVLTYPGMLFERHVGLGALIVDLITQNRTVHSRSVAYLLGRSRDR